MGIGGKALLASTVGLEIRAGIDIHKRRCNSATMDEQGRILDQAAFTNTKDGFACLIERIKPYGDAKVVLESTGNFWLKSYDPGRRPKEGPLQVLSQVRRPSRSGLY